MKTLLLTTILLTSCQSKKIDQRIYQPSVLIVPAGVPIKTTEGVFIPEETQIWHSAKTVENLERKLSNF